MADRPFKVIDGTPAPDTAKERRLARLRAQKKPEHVVRCHRCTGISVIVVRIGMTWRNGKPVGGQRQMICETCLGNGERVVIGV